MGMAKGKVDLSIIVVSFNTKVLLSSCINSIFEYTKNVKFEIIVVDNNSNDGSAEIAKKLGAIVIKNKENLGFAAANNQGLKASKGEYVLFLNSDTELHDNVLDEMVPWMDSNPKVGISTCSLLFKDGNLQGTGGYFPTLPRVFMWMLFLDDIPWFDKIINSYHPHKDYFKNFHKQDWVTGAFLLTRRKIMNKVVGWDESYFMYVEEVDLCFRIKKLGYDVCYLPKWTIIHYGGASSKTSEFSLISEYKGVKKFYVKYYANWQSPILRLILKMGALGRILLFGILEGRRSVKIYAKAFMVA